MKEEKNNCPFKNDDCPTCPKYTTPELSGENPVMTKNDEGVPSRNDKVLKSFVLFCLENPELRFWQALRAWSKADNIFWNITDTFYWEGKNK